jgi:hypothetical protein
MTNTELTVAQAAILEGLERKFSDTRVVGWDERLHGPRLLFADGRLRTLTTLGRQVPCRKVSNA